MNLFRRTMAFLSRRRQSYELSCTAPTSLEMMKDLAKFCRANESCYHQEDFMRGVLTGRREVWLRIQAHLNLSDRELWRLYNPSMLAIDDGDDDGRRNAGETVDGDTWPNG